MSWFYRWRNWDTNFWSLSKNVLAREWWRWNKNKARLGAHTCHIATSLTLCKMLSITEKRMRVSIKSMECCSFIQNDIILMVWGFTTYFVLFNNITSQNSNENLKHLFSRIHSNILYIINTILFVGSFYVYCVQGLLTNMYAQSSIPTDKVAKVEI